MRLHWMAIVLLASCGPHDPRTDRPPADVVARIEALLAGRPCIGSLDRWERHYQYGTGPGPYQPPNWSVDHDRIHFSFVEAGRYRYRAMRVIDTVTAGDLDERAMRVAFGEYHLASGRLFVHMCGENTDPPSPAAFDSMNSARNAAR